MIPRIIPHVFYTQRAVRSTGLELTVSLPNMLQLINNVIPKIKKVSQEKKIQVKTVSCQDPRLSRARLSTDKSEDNPTTQTLLKTKKHAEFSWTSWDVSEAQRKKQDSILSKPLVQKESTETASPTNQSQPKKVKRDSCLHPESTADKSGGDSVKNVKPDVNSAKNVNSELISAKNIQPGGNSNSVKNVKPDDSSVNDPKVKKGDPDITFDVKQLYDPDEDDDDDMDLYEPSVANINAASVASKDSNTAGEEYNEIPNALVSKLLDKKLFSNKIEVAKDNNDAIESEPLKELNAQAIKDGVPDRINMDINATVFRNNDENVEKYLDLFSSLTTCPNFQDFAIAYLKVKVCCFDIHILNENSKINPYKFNVLRTIHTNNIVVFTRVFLDIMNNIILRFKYELLFITFLFSRERQISKPVMRLFSIWNLTLRLIACSLCLTLSNIKL